MSDLAKAEGKTFTDSWGGVNTIIAMSTHRNGIGGATFLFTVLYRKDRSDRQATGQFLVTSVLERSRRATIEKTGALKIDLLPDIAFAEGNSWRGSDMFGAGVTEIYQEACVADGYKGFEED